MSCIVLLELLSRLERKSTWASIMKFFKLKEGKPTFLDETYTILRLGYPEAVHSVLSFPLMQDDQLAWVLQIYNSELDEDSVQILQTYCKHLSIIFENILLKGEIEAGSNILSVVTEFNDAIGAQLEAPELYRTILLKAAEVLKAEQASLMIYDETSGDLAIKFVKGLNEKIVQNLRLKPGEGIAGFVFETGKPLLVNNINEDSRFETRQRARYKTKSLMSIPLKVHHRKIGVLNVADKIGEDSFNEKDLKLFESIAGHAAVALERTGFYRMSEDLRKISLTDSLTELYNRRFFQDRMNEEIERARRHSHPVSLIMLDIDDFKNYNDTYGHLAGDEALRLTASIIKNSVRNIDLVVRYGGEEFAVILPLTETIAARDIAERIRTGVSGRFFPDDSMRTSVRLTVSLGIASFPIHAGNMIELVGNADKALYLAKVSGKNKVRFFSSSDGLQSTNERIGRKSAPNSVFISTANRYSLAQMKFRDCLDEELPKFLLLAEDFTSLSKIRNPNGTFKSIWAKGIRKNDRMSFRTKDVQQLFQVGLNTVHGLSIQRFPREPKEIWQNSGLATGL